MQLLWSIKWCLIVQPEPRSGSLIYCFHPSYHCHFNAHPPTSSSSSAAVLFVDDDDVEVLYKFNPSGRPQINFLLLIELNRSDCGPALGMVKWTVETSSLSLDSLPVCLSFVNPQVIRSLRRKRRLFLESFLITPATLVVVSFRIPSLPLFSVVSPFFYPDSSCLPALYGTIHR